MVAEGFLQARKQAPAKAGGTLRAALALHDVEHRAANPAGQRIAPEGRAVVARGKQLGRLATRQASPDREAIAQGLGQGDHVRHDPGMLETEPLAGASHAGLHFIGHQQPVVLVAQLTQSLQVSGGCRVHPTLALHRLDQHGDDVR
ncbi:hypothetical protein D9M69_475420 [compost metagenome]